jgi:hypothetical protein
MSVAPFVEILVGVTHGLWSSPSEHDLEVHRLEAAVLVAVDNAGRTGNTFPQAEPYGDAITLLVLDENVEVAL